MSLNFRYEWSARPDLDGRIPKLLEVGLVALRGVVPRSAAQRINLWYPPCQRPRTAR